MAFKVFGNEVFTATDVDTYLMQQAIIVCTSGTRPSSPVVGMHVWETDTQSDKVWDGSNWLFNKGLNLFIRKTTTESVSSTTTLQNDDELTLAVAANSTYYFETYIICNSTTTADMRISFTVPSGASMGWVTYAPFTAQTAVDQAFISVTSLIEGSFASVAGFAADVAICPRGVLVTGSSGQFTFQFAQDTSAGTSTQVLANSWLYLRKVG